MGKLAASHSGTPPLRTRTLMPFRSSSAATCVLTSSFGIRIVGDDIAAAGDGDRIDGVGRHPDGARELDGAVFVGVFQANVENRGLLAPIQTFLQLFFADAFDGHGAILAVRQRNRQGGGSGLGRALLRGDVAGDERQRARPSRHLLARHRHGHRDQRGCSLCTDQPFDRLPQWMQRRKMEPDEQVTPKS